MPDRDRDRGRGRRGARPGGRGPDQRRPITRRMGSVGSHEFGGTRSARSDRQHVLHGSGCPSDCPFGHGGTGARAIRSTVPDSVSGFVVWATSGLLARAQRHRERACASRRGRRRRGEDAFAGPSTTPASGRSGDDSSRRTRSANSSNPPGFGAVVQLLADRHGPPPPPLDGAHAGIGNRGLAALLARVAQREPAGGSATATSKSPPVGSKPGAPAKAKPKNSTSEFNSYAALVKDGFQELSMGHQRAWGRAGQGAVRARGQPGSTPAAQPEFAPCWWARPRMTGGPSGPRLRRGPVWPRSS